VPLHLRNASSKLAKELNYAKNYEWKAGFKPSEGFLPEELVDINFF
jgi:replication-associated recombination protein RarA